MGLDSFKTEGPRTYTKKRNTISTYASDCVHIPKDADIDDDLVPNNVEVHEIVMREYAISVGITGASYVFICSTCGTISESAESFIKIDRLNNNDTDWYADVYDETISLVNSRTLNEWEDICDVDYSNVVNEEEIEKQKEEEEIQLQKNKSGLDAFKS